MHSGVQWKLTLKLLGSFLYATTLAGTLSSMKPFTDFFLWFFFNLTTLSSQ
jgi:hypothetical protein